jgi:hypothetical protein
MTTCFGWFYLKCVSFKLFPSHAVPFVTKCTKHKAWYFTNKVILCRHLQLLFVYLSSLRGTCVRLHNSVRSAWKRCDLHTRLDIICHTFIRYCKNIKGGNTNLHGQLSGKCKWGSCLNYQNKKKSCIKCVAEISYLRGRYSVSSGKSFFGSANSAEGGKGIFQNVEHHFPKDVESHPRRTESPATLLWESRISQVIFIFLFFKFYSRSLYLRCTANIADPWLLFLDILKFYSTGLKP